MSKDDTVEVDFGCGLLIAIVILAIVAIGIIERVTEHKEKMYQIELEHEKTKAKSNSGQDK